MIDNDERLLQQFFSEAANQKIEDNGFTDRVMQQLASSNVQRSTFNVSHVCGLGSASLSSWYCL